MSLIRGSITNVYIAPAGTELVGDVTSGQTLIYVDDAYPFESTGVLIIGGVIRSYTAVDYEVNSITLSAGLGVAALTGDEVLVSPLGESKWAMIWSDDLDEGIRALIPFSMTAQIADGMREERDQEQVLISDETGRWEVKALDEEVPVIPGTFIESGTIGVSKIVIGDATNIVTDWTAMDLGTWSGLGGAWTIETPTVDSPNDNNSRVFRYTANNAYAQISEPEFPVIPGEIYTFGMVNRLPVATTGSGNIGLMLFFYDAAMNYIGLGSGNLDFINAAYSSPWSVSTASTTVPAGAVYGQVVLRATAGITAGQFEFDQIYVNRQVRNVRTSNTGLRIELAVAANAFQSGSDWASVAFYNGVGGWDPGLLWANYVAGSPNQSYLSLVAPYPSGSTSAAARISLSSFSDGTRKIDVFAKTLNITAATMNLDPLGTASFDFNLSGATQTYVWKNAGAERMQLNFGGGDHGAAHQLRFADSGNAVANAEIKAANLWIVAGANEDVWFGASAGGRPILQSQNNSLALFWGTTRLKAGNSADSLVDFEAFRVYANGVLLTSDIDLKKNLKPVKGAMDMLDALPVYDYTLKNKDFRDRIHTGRGVMAQDLEKVMPGAVDSLEDGSLTVDVYALLGTAIAAIKELRAEVARLKP
jgi:hypothetical protein